MPFQIGVVSAALAMLAPAVVLFAAVAEAQTTITYRCTAKDGKRYYGSAIPTQCVGRPVEQLNAQGLVVRRIDPDGDEKERAEKAVALSKKREEEALNKEESRRSRALLATYTSERDIEEARARALADNQKAVQEVEVKIEALRKRLAGYEKELEFYKDKSKAPAKLTEDISNADIDLKAQENLLSMKKKEVQMINTKYDQDKKRYAELTRRR